jgi:hypothetical protein
VLAAAALVACIAVAPAGAHSNAWQKNTFHVTPAGVFHGYFLMPKWPHGSLFFIQLIAPSSSVDQCTLRYGKKTEPARSVGATTYEADIYFWWPKKGSATRATATCSVSVGQVLKATVVLRSHGTIRLRKR